MACLVRCQSDEVADGLGRGGSEEADDDATCRRALYLQIQVNLLRHYCLFRLSPRDSEDRRPLQQQTNTPHAKRHRFSSVRSLAPSQDVLVTKDSV